MVRNLICEVLNLSLYADHLGQQELLASNFCMGESLIWEGLI